jgi:hypothetical protein
MCHYLASHSQNNRGWLGLFFLNRRLIQLFRQRSHAQMKTRPAAVDFYDLPVQKEPAITPGELWSRVSTGCFNQMFVRRRKLSESGY